MPRVVFNVTRGFPSFRGVERTDGGGEGLIALNASPTSSPWRTCDKYAMKANAWHQSDQGVDESTVIQEWSKIAVDSADTLAIYLITIYHQHCPPGGLPEGFGFPMPLGPLLIGVGDDSC